MIKESLVPSRSYRLVRWGSALCLVFAWASACSGSDKNVTGRENGGAAGESSAAAGAPTSSGGSSATPDEAGAAGQALGGAATGTGGADGGASLGGAAQVGGAAFAGAGGAGGAGEGDVCPDAPAESAGAGCQWKTVLACNSGVKIADWCGEGMMAATLERCPAGGGGLYTPDADYRDHSLSPCATDCPVDAAHVVWRCIECCPIQ